MEKTIKVTVRVPKDMKKKLDESISTLKRYEIFESRSEAVRYYVNRLIEEKLKKYQV